MNNVILFLMSAIQPSTMCDPGLVVCGSKEEPDSWAGVLLPWLCGFDEASHISGGLWDPRIGLAGEKVTDFCKREVCGLLHITRGPHKAGISGPQYYNPSPKSFPWPSGISDTLGEGTEVAEAC